MGSEVAHVFEPFVPEHYLFPKQEEAELTFFHGGWGLNAGGAFPIILGELALNKGQTTKTFYFFSPFNVTAKSIIAQRKIKKVSHPKTLCFAVGTRQKLKGRN